VRRQIAHTGPDARSWRTAPDTLDRRHRPCDIGGMSFLSIIILAVIFYLFVSIRVLRQYERGVVFLLGKFAGVRGPGLTLIFVPIQQMVRVSLRTVTMQIPSQKIITKDNVSIDIAAVAYYRISDPEKAVIAIENVYNAINQISQTTVRNVVGRFSLDQLLSETSSINEQIKNVIDGHTEPWGTQVTAVEIKDIVLPDNMQRAMAREAEAERETAREDRRRRRRISGGGEARGSRRHHHQASGGAAAAHVADGGGDFDREELDHHLPRAIHDHGAGGARHPEEGFGIELTRAFSIQRTKGGPRPPLRFSNFSRIRPRELRRSGDCGRQ
jgi:regulator of protease activity HflC (stomatin/prohibitin superfamily)